MTFFSEALRGDLILLRIDRKPPPTRGIVPRRVHRQSITAIAAGLLLWFLATFCRPVLDEVRQAWEMTGRRWAVIIFFLAIIWQVILEGLATGYVEKVLIG